MIRKPNALCAVLVLIFISGQIVIAQNTSKSDPMKTQPLTLSLNSSTVMLEILPFPELSQSQRPVSILQQEEKMSGEQKMNSILFIFRRPVILISYHVSKV